MIPDDLPTDDFEAGFVDVNGRFISYGTACDLAGIESSDDL